MRRYICAYIYIYAHALCWEVRGMARPVPQRPPPPAVRLATCLRRRPIARMHGQHPSGPDFVFSRRPRAGMHTCACAPRSPGPVRAGLQNNCAPAINGMCIHQHPPCPLHVRSHVPISACSIRTRYITVHQMHPRASRIRFPINIVPGHAPVTGPSSAANNPGPGGVRPRRPWGFLWQNRLKTAPPKLISSLFFCPLRLLWKKCRGRPIFHRLRVSKLSKTSHPSHVIAMYGYIEYYQRIYTVVRRSIG
jgi:hypothetical protein